jgi:hypothetical protein
MKYSLLFAVMILIAAKINAQENNTIKTPPIKASNNVKPQLGNTAQSLPIKATDNAKSKTVNTVEAVPLKTAAQVQQSKTTQAAQTVPIKNTDAGGKNSAISPTPNKMNAPANSKLPSSVSSDKAKEQLQKRDTTSLPVRQ